MSETVNHRVAKLKGWEQERFTGSWVMPDGRSRIFGEPPYLTPAGSFALYTELVDAGVIVHFIRQDGIDPETGEPKPRSYRGVMRVHSRPETWHVGETLPESVAECWLAYTSGATS